MPAAAQRVGAPVRKPAALAQPAGTASIVHKMAEAAASVDKQTLIMENAEKVFHNDANVVVTQSRFMASGRTYTMRNISSVSVYTVEKSKKLQIALLAVGCLMALTGGGVQIAGFAIAIGALVWLFTMKNNYAVRISTNAGESNSLTSADKAYVQKIVNAVNEAIVYRG